MLFNGKLREHSNILVRFLHFFDTVCIVLTLYFLAGFYGIGWTYYLTLLSAMSCVVGFCVFYMSSLYRPWRGSKFYVEFCVIIKAWIVFIGIISFVFFCTKISNHYSRKLILSWFWLTPFMIFLVHLFGRTFLRKLRKKGFNLKNAVIVGGNEIGIRFAKFLQGLDWAGIRVEGFFDDHLEQGKPVYDGIRVLGSISELKRFLKQEKTEYVYIALPLNELDEIRDMLCDIRTSGAKVYFVPDVFSLRLLNAELITLGDILLLSFNPEVRGCKRCFDIICSSLVLILGAPLYLIIALLIKMQDGGCIFYAHKRVTMAGKEFRCWKFRTMVEDAEIKLKEILDADPVAREEWRHNFKLKDDSRVTKIGKFLRKTSLDELPQFFNVLKGEMSVVGARPIVTEELKEYYGGNAGIYCSSKPGITGPWQVGERNDVENYDERINLEIGYIQNNSLMDDIKIVGKTISKVIWPNGAY